MDGGSLVFVVVIIFIALAFDFTNGLHDAANSVATIVSTRVLSPKRAVIWAAFFNFVAFLIFGTAVASTIGKGLIDITVVDPLVIFGVTALTAGYMLFILFVVVRWRRRVGATLGRSTGPVVPVGAVAEVRSGLLPVGVVYLAGEEWSARTEDGVAIGAGTPVRVVRQDGLTLIVEPTERGPSTA